MNILSQTELDSEFAQKYKEMKEFGLRIILSEEAKREEELDLEYSVQRVKRREGSWTSNNLAKE